MDAKARGELINLMDEPWLREWRLWFLVDNRFRGDARFKTQHILLPKRKVARRNQLTAEERRELDLIEDTFGEDNYDLVLRNFDSGRSIKDHFHVQLVVYLDRANFKL